MIHDAFFAKITRRPWRSRRFETPRTFERLPTMLTQEELRMLTWLVENVPIPGDVVDLGCFLGGSTVALALGARRSLTSRQVDAFDRFRIDEKHKYLYLYQRGRPFFAGEDALPIFRQLTADYADLVTPRPGDVLESRWDGRPIAVLFIDVSKSRQINDHILSEFFPHLNPGSLIVQQDFLFFRNPWLLSTMMKLAPWIEMLAAADDNSVVFGVREQPNRAALEACFDGPNADAEYQEAIDWFLPRFHEARHIEMLEALRATVVANPGVAEAWRYPNVTGLPA